jgi:transposase
MDQYAGIDVSLERSSVCIVDAAGKIIREAKVPSEPSTLIALFEAHGTARRESAWRLVPCLNGSMPG